MIGLSEKIGIGVDIGGTNLRIVLGTESGEFIEKIEREVKTESKASISIQIIEEIKNLFEEQEFDLDQLEAVGIASTGPLDMDKGILRKPSNLPFTTVPLVNPIENEFDLPVYLLNDCIAGVLGEKVYGAGRDTECDNILYVNIGTGIGGGAIIDDHLLLGRHGNVAEIGHMTVDSDREMNCGCGKRGHWEAYCSGRNIPEFVKYKLSKESGMRIKNSAFLDYVDVIDEIDAKRFYEVVRSGDDLALEIQEEIIRFNCIGFGNLIDNFDPSIITVGGSVALKNKEQVLDPMVERINDYTRNEVPDIITTSLGNEIGLYGALALAFQGEKYY